MTSEASADFLDPHPPECTEAPSAPSSDASSFSRVAGNGRKAQRCMEIDSVDRSRLGRVAQRHLGAAPSDNAESRLELENPFEVRGACSEPRSGTEECLAIVLDSSVCDAAMARTK